MTVAELLSQAGIPVDLASVDQQQLAKTPSGVFYDSREVVDGGVFVAVPGEKLDGSVFIDDAKGRGATIAISEEEPPLQPLLPWIRVSDARAALAALAAVFYENPSHALLVIGVTGTNGKTTTTYLIESILTHSGYSTGRLSSISNHAGSAQREQYAVRTTPESPDVQAWLKAMSESNADACVMEVSSHGLALRRVDQVKFAAGVFTNLTRDHLEFHGDMRTYFEAKSRLFEMLPEGAPSVLNLDDSHGQKLATFVDCPFTYGFHDNADVAPTRLELTSSGTRLEVRTPRGGMCLESPLVGKVSAYNVLAAVATCVALDLPFRGIEDGVRALAGVPGRIQTITQQEDDVTVIVDFAHTDDALRALLEAVRCITVGQVITVFGCGGDRDATKRPLMGAVAARLSDRVVVTSDNPRSEDPNEIIAEIERGIRESQTPWVSVISREEAISHAIAEATSGDLVVVAGKGHEQTQEIGEATIPFDDVTIARSALLRRRSGFRAG